MGYLICGINGKIEKFKISKPKASCLFQHSKNGLCVLSW